MNEVLETLVKIAVESWSLLGQMAPYLLLGFLVAGGLSVCISPKFVERHLGGRGFASVLKASLLGIPLPLCSCGVIPVSASLRRHGASRAATTSFLISTPQTGVDSIAVTYALLGSVFAVYRPLAALAAGLLGGLLVILFARRNHAPDQPEPDRPKCTESCCSDHGSQNVFVRALKHGLVTLPRDIGLPLLAGVVVAGAVAALAPPNEWQEYLGSGIVGIVLAMVLGVPVYVCATASAPIAVGLIHLGASPGAALAFLIAGPATNAATITTMWKFLGGRATVLYLLTIAVSAVVGGLTLDWLFATLDVGVPTPAGHDHHTAMGVWLSSAWAILLLAILAFSYLVKSHDDEWHGQLP
ncbi:MAG: SO_0444 family Cu/Zn efflux transporter [Planctomycetes bacterium]|nr:SO_0444 family Cu/Zn efflux transporter [Planctomycetota bacterium]MBU4400153.1 SO_0444 family Cu/Zn efflux transporter [Planctomycetota bacterium]MCG2684915.1 SO_0444 family Cu/Zn efflux transporter [Planctomycetales bacterium]